MKTKIFALFCFCLLAFATMCVAGDSTSIAPAGVTKQSHTYTNGDNVYTSGGKVDTGGGAVYAGGGNVDTQGGRVYTRGNHLYTSGGNLYAGGGDIRQVRLIKTNRLYAKGSGNWINAYDHLDMNNRVIYDVRRIRVNDYTPSHYKDLASKWYVDKNAGAPQGTMCGMWSNNPYIRDRCKGHNPKNSCPSGYAKRFDGTDFGTCVKQ